MKQRISSFEPQPFEQAHIDTVRQLAPECMVLLKNDGTLPLSQVGPLALYGNGARQTLKRGRWLRRCQCQTLCKCGRRPSKRWFSNHHQKVAQ